MDRATFLLRKKRQDALLEEDALALSARQLDVKPHWVPVIQKRLPFWQAGLTSFPLEGGAYITLKKQGRVPRKEVLCHEWVHACRYPFEGTLFEEFLAFKSSSSSWRVWCAGMFATTKRALCFSLLLVAALFCDLLSLWLPGFFILGIWIKGGAALWLFSEALSSVFLYQKFCSCRLALERVVAKKLSLPIMLRLTDEEICLFAKSSEKELLSYVQKQAKKELRWKVLLHSYFS